ncbi:hypothetical protein [Streptomonospora litoralis]|uniref:Lantibiotic michiganin-A n=1 Tax=Streptomonospora litoralis TaxID=2498135 RepID=A0A4V0ZJD2_9ACTN|nr:hypothetical protein [Streptomonospora litoralis]QBI53072.1 Lantibiotic michiganin-A precursor [Streptomonospora litoralis]
MSTALLERTETEIDPAGATADDLHVDNLISESHDIYAASSGWVCTLTIECGTLVCACQ